MGKIKVKNIITGIKIKPAFFMYAVMFFVLALILSGITIHLVDNFFSTVAVYYIHTNDDIDRINEDDDEDVRIAVDLIDEDFDESSADAILFYARNWTVVLALALYFIIGIIIAAKLFFKRKLDVPLKELSSAAQKISEENLDFKINYDGKDEMGKLCKSFEIMRQQLFENNKKMWDMIDEQKRVQHVFSHDIRTPLTVTMGYLDVLCQYIPEGKMSPEKINETLEIMRKNLVRMENFINTMSNMQKIDDIEVNFENTDIEEFYKSLEQISQMICQDKLIVFNSTFDTKNVYIDTFLTEQIVFNVLSNASRYALKKVEINCFYSNNQLTIVIKDDGKGFSEDALKHLFDSYYTEEDKSASEHFGIGLTICQKLCEKMGGKIICENDNGAKISIYL